MKYIRSLLVGAAIVSLGYFFLMANRDVKDRTAENADQKPEVTQGGFETKIDERGQVSVTVVPRTLRGAQQWEFDVVFDTHSVNLDHDLMQIAELADDKGNAYMPLLWEGAGPGGHHREGVLVFEAVEPVPSFVELKIKNVGGISERSFQWSMK